MEGSHPDQAGEISLYYLADEISHTMRGLDALVSPSTWSYYQELSPRELALCLRSLAMLVPYGKYTKRPPGKKAPPGPRKPTKRINHVSTAKVLNQKHDKTD